MKYLVASDLHKDEKAYELLKEIILREKCGKAILLGDFDAGSCGGNTVSRLIEIMDGMPCPVVCLRGNGDFDSISDGLCISSPYLKEYMDGRTLFFSHGHIYEYSAQYKAREMEKGSVCLQGHKHIGQLSLNNGVIFGCTGSLSASYARDGRPSYVIIDETSVTLKKTDGEIIDRIDY